MFELDNVSHIYPNGTRALDNVTLSIPHGMFGLLGPNGAGKSTLMRAIATLQVPSEGSIRFAELDILTLPDLLRRKLGDLPQDVGVYPRVSAYDMLDQMAVLKGIAGKSLPAATLPFTPTVHMHRLRTIEQPLIGANGARHGFAETDAPLSAHFYFQDRLTGRLVLNDGDIAVLQVLRLIGPKAGVGEGQDIVMHLLGIPLMTIVERRA